MAAVILGGYVVAGGMAVVGVAFLGFTILGVALLGLSLVGLAIEGRSTPGSGAKGFDQLSRVYDFLVALVYGRALRRAQTCFLGKVEAGAKVIVVGGGTGWFLEALFRQAQPRQVIYVELSKGMLEKSRDRIMKRLPEIANKVEWVHGTVHDLPDAAEFDLVCTHCFLDLFDGETLEREVKALRSRMRPKANWYFSDFHYAYKWPMNWISRMMIWGMYRFFRWTCGIQARRLGDFAGVLDGNGLKAEAQRFHYGGMLESVWYESLGE